MSGRRDQRAPSLAATAPLAVSEERFRALITATAQIVWTTDPDGRVAEDSPSWRAYTGQSVEEWSGLGWLDAIHPDDRELTFSGWSSAIANRRIYDGEYRVRTAAGPYRWMSVRAVPILDASGTIREWVGMNTDINDRRAIDAAQLEYRRLMALRADVGVSLAGSAAVPATLQRCAESVVHHLDMAFAKVWTLDDATGTLELQASAGQYGHPDGLQETIRLGEGKIGRVADSRQPYLTNAVQTDPNIRDHEWARRDGMRAFAGYPLISGGRVLGVLGMFSRTELSEAVLGDLTPLADGMAQYLERHRTEAILRLTEARNAAILSSALDAIVTSDSSGCVVEWNPAAERLFGYGRDAAIGRDMAELIVPPAMREAHRGGMARYVATGESRILNQRMELTATRADGAEFPVELTVTRISADGPPIFTAHIRDITDRRRTEATTQFLADASAALAELTDYQSTLRSVAGLAIPFFADWCSVDLKLPDGTVERLAVTHVDPARVRLVEELFRLYPPRPGDPHGVMRVLRTSEPEWVEVIEDSLLVAVAHDAEHLRRIRELGIRSFIAVPLRSRARVFGVMTFALAESGRNYGLKDVAAAIDLADRAAIAVENAELLRTLKDSDRRKDEFLAMLAHELRNPLAPIRNAIQIVRHDSAVTNRLTWATDVIDRQVQQMARLVDDLLDVSRITRGTIELRREPVEIATVIRSAVEASRPLIDKSAHELTVAVPEEPLLLDADPTRLAQVVLNLLNNAAKYTDSGGRINLAVRRDDDHVVIAVRDTGIGMPREMLERIFDLFTQVDRSLERAEGGLGIGLTLVQRLVEMHGGTVTAHSGGHGEGSELIVRLPLSGRQGAGSQLPLPHSPPTPPRTLRILVVDDNHDAADSLAMLLRMLGHEVHTAHDGLAAVGAAAVFGPEVVLLDIGLPKLNGYEAAARIRLQDGGEAILMVALTGWGQDDDRRRSRDAGFDHHFTKPIDFDALQRLLGDYSATDIRKEQE